MQLFPPSDPPAWSNASHPTEAAMPPPGCTDRTTSVTVTLDFYDRTPPHSEGMLDVTHRYLPLVVTRRPVDAERHLPVHNGFDVGAGSIRDLLTSRTADLAHFGTPSVL
ncbi:MAG: hypothetical protein M1823_006099 [Watsoniomyces obsoletus]|nr:MAG: hypothetical protein M1823_006099 [Watsoniomyces obsoletus]